MTEKKALELTFSRNQTKWVFGPEIAPTKNNNFDHALFFLFLFYPALFVLFFPKDSNAR
jgi:hypothetical protein